MDPTNKLIDIRNKLAIYIHQNKTCFHNLLNKKQFNELPEYYPIIIWDNKQVHERLDIGGMTYLEGIEWKQISSNVKTASKNNIISMYVLLTSDWNRTVYHFIHEIAHTVTLAEQHKNIKDKLLQPYEKTSGKYIPYHHPESFYRNLAVLLRIAKKLNIWIPSSDFIGFDSKSLIRFDTFTIL
jgi:hypothetical protein